MPSMMAAATNPGEAMTIQIFYQAGNIERGRDHGRENVGQVRAHREGQNEQLGERRIEGRRRGRQCEPCVRAGGSV